jgi:hypothetical protein
MIALLTQWRVLAAIGAAAGVAMLLALWRLEAAEAKRWRDQAQAAEAARSQAVAQAAAAGDAEAVIAKGAARDQQTVTLHAENSHDIQAATGSGQNLDLALNAAGRRSLCRHPSYSLDPACVALRGADPGQRPPAGGPDAPAGG